jgi:hypothetical protein
VDTEVLQGALANNGAFTAAAKMWPAALADAEMLQSLLGLLVNLSADSAHAQAVLCSAKAWALLLQGGPCMHTSPV